MIDLFRFFFSYLCAYGIITNNDMNSEIIELSKYLKPTLRVQLLDIESAICESPVPGGNEDIGYEDWSI